MKSSAVMSAEVVENEKLADYILRYRYTIDGVTQHASGHRAGSPCHCLDFAECYRVRIEWHRPEPGPLVTSKSPVQVKLLPTEFIVATYQIGMLNWS